MTISNLQKGLISLTLEKIGSEIVMAQLLANLLGKSKANIYKKIKGEIQFTIIELETIANHFGLSLDKLLKRNWEGYDRISLDYSLSQEEPRSPLLFIEKIRNDISRIAGLQRPMIRYASSEIPIFHSLRSRNLLAFKLYVWSRTNWRLPELLHTKFDAEEIYRRWPAIEQYRNEAYQSYLKIPTTEYWSRGILDNFLNQIRHYAAIQMFANPDMPEILYQELDEMLDTCERYALSSQKEEASGIGKPVGFSLFLNEIAPSNNIILIYSEDIVRSVYMTVDHPNFMRSTDPVFCNRLHNWVLQVHEASFTTTHERERFSLFSDLRERIIQYGASVRNQAQQA